MYIAARTEESVSDQLQPILGSALRNELGRRPFAALLSPERGQMMDNIQNALNRVARQYGARDRSTCGSSMPTCPTAPRSQSAFERMRTARAAGGAIDPGARAASRRRSSAPRPMPRPRRPMPRAFNKDPEFYDFYRAMQSYRTTFLGNGPRHGAPRRAIILSPNNEYLREFRGAAMRRASVSFNSRSAADLATASHHAAERASGHRQSERKTPSCVTFMALPPPFCSAAPPRR